MNLLGRGAIGWKTTLLAAPRIRLIWACVLGDIRWGAFGWLVLGLALLAGAVWVNRSGLDQIMGQLGSADWRLAVAALVCMATADCAKALRWRVLYGRMAPGYQRVLQAQVVGQAANMLVPLRLGEVLRVSWAASTPGGVARGAAGLVLTKAIDAVALVGLIVWIFGGALVPLVTLLSAVGAGLVVAIALAVAQRYRHMGGGGLSAVRPLLAGTARYASELHVDTMCIVLAASAFAWLVGGLANLGVLAAVGAPLSLDAAIRILVSGYVAGFLPAPPGRLGVFEAAVAAALVAGGMQLTSAIAVAVMLHAVQLVEIGLLVLVATRWR